MNIISPILHDLLGKDELNRIKLVHDAVLSNYHNDLAPVKEFYDRGISIARLIDCKDQYFSTPPEFITFAEMGVDGVVYGYLFLSPEIEDQITPIAQYVPIDCDKISLLGRNFFEFFDYQLTFNHNEGMLEDFDEAELEKLIDNLRISGVPIFTEFSSRRYDADESGMSSINAIVNIPDDYLFFETSDGIGVLAKNSVFDPKESHKITAFSFEEGYAKSIEAINSNYWGTSLFFLKELYFDKHLTREEFKAIVDGLKKVYSELGRSKFNTILEQNVVNYIE